MDFFQCLGGDGGEFQSNGGDGGEFQCLGGDGGDFTNYIFLIGGDGGDFNYRRGIVTKLYSLESVQHGDHESISSHSVPKLAGWVVGKFP